MKLDFEDDRVVVTMTKREAGIVNKVFSNITPQGVKSVEGFTSIRRTYVENYRYHSNG